MNEPRPATSWDAQRLHEGLAFAREQPIGDRQAAARRLGAAMRSAIEALVSTQAPADVLDDVTHRLEAVVRLLTSQPPGRTLTAEDGGRSSSYLDWSPLAGLANPLAPPIETDIVGQTVLGTVEFGSAYEGPPGCVHGGYLAAAFDDVLGLTQSLSGLVGMTGTLQVRYRRPTPLRTALHLVGRLDSVEGRKILTSATLSANGEVTAEAQAVFVSVEPERFAALGDG